MKNKTLNTDIGMAEDELSNTINEMLSRRSY